MTLRKPTYGGGVQKPVASLDPATSTSPTSPLPQSPHTESSSSKATFLPNDVELQRQRQDFQSPRGLSSKGLNADESPPTSEEDGGEVDSQSRSHSNFQPPSLQVSQQLVTSTPSLESQHFIPTESSETLGRDLGNPPQWPSKARPGLTNPFLHNLDTDPLPPTNLVNESSSVDVWADKKPAVNANIHQEQYPGPPSPS